MRPTESIDPRANRPPRPWLRLVRGPAATTRRARLLAWSSSAGEAASSPASRLRPARLALAAAAVVLSSVVPVLSEAPPAAAQDATCEHTSEIVQERKPAIGLVSVSMVSDSTARVTVATDPTDKTLHLRYGKEGTDTAGWFVRTPIAADRMITGFHVGGLEAAPSIGCTLR